MFRTLKPIEIALLKIPSVEDCYVLDRETSGKELQKIAYVVSTGRFIPQHVHEVLPPLFPSEELPHAYVSLTHLPFTETGEVDEEALKCFEVIETSLIQRWESTLQTYLGTDQVVVIAHERTQPSSLLHLSEVLPEWTTQGSYHLEESSVPAWDMIKAGEKKNLRRAWPLAKGNNFLRQPMFLRPL